MRYVSVVGFPIEVGADTGPHLVARSSHNFFPCSFELNQNCKLDWSGLTRGLEDVCEPPNCRRKHKTHMDESSHPKRWRNNGMEELCLAAMTGIWTLECSLVHGVLT